MPIMARPDREWRLHGCAYRGGRVRTFESCRAGLDSRHRGSCVVVSRLGMSAVLLLVDVQTNMLEPPTPVPDAASVGTEIERLLERARAADATVVHIRNNGSADDPDAPGSAGWELVQDVRLGEHVVDKHEPNAFVDTALAELIPEACSVVIAGMQSEYCVRETSLAALRRGHAVTLVRGAHATYDGDVPAVATQERVEHELRGAGARIVDTDERLFE
jgi:nicotinamidase-related amidase